MYGNQPVRDYDAESGQGETLLERARREGWTEAPSFEERIPYSYWVDHYEGLREAALEWHKFAVPERERLARKARRLTTPGVRFSHLGRAGQITGEIARVAGEFALWDFGPVVVASRTDGRDAAREHAATAGARRIRLAFERLGPTFIKFGQLIASARGLVPDDVADEFSRCRDEVPPFPFHEVRETVEGELGAPIDEVFASFDEQPLAAASIAQVHPAVLADGRHVVVKVQRPQIAGKIERDVQVLSDAVALLNLSTPRFRQANFAGIIRLFAETVVEELDFRLEADNMVECGVGMELLEVDEVYVPHPIPGLVTPRVLVMERLDGVKFDDTAQMRAAGVDTHGLLRAGMRSVIEGAVVAGVFHGDLHTGNLSIMRDARFGLMDFGIVARMSPERRDSLIRFLVALATDNTPALVEAFAEFDAFPNGVDVDALAHDLQAGARRRGSTNITELSMDTFVDGLSDTFGTFGRHGAHVPKDLVMFTKNLIYLNDAARVMAPEMNLLAEIDVIYRYFEEKYGDQMKVIAASVLGG